MPRTRSQTKITNIQTNEVKTTDMNRLPAEIFFLIIQRLSLENKFVLKAVCKKWHTFLISHILPKQHKLSIEKDDFSYCHCIDPDHQFNLHDKDSIPIVAVREYRNRKKFFEKEVTGVKVLKICEDTDVNRVTKYCLSEGLSSSLECVDIARLEEPLVKVLPNLKHFTSGNINLISFISVLEYCPILTHLSVCTFQFVSDNFVDTLMKLPKGLQYLKLGGKTSNSLAVFCSPAMETLETVLLYSGWYSSQSFDKPDARIKPAPSLRSFSMKCYMGSEEDQRMNIEFIKKCPALKKIDLYVEELTLEDYVNIYSGLSNLEIISLALKFEFDDVIRMILERNKKSLKHLYICTPKDLYIDRLLLNLESMEKLAEFPNLQTLSFASHLVRTLVLSKF